MSTKEVIWDTNGSNPTSLDTSVIADLVVFDLASRNVTGQASFQDGVGIHNYAEELAFQRDGTPRRY